MQANVDREQVRRLVARGAQLVEVLAEEEYGEEHIAGAINIPLRQLDDLAPRLLSRETPVIVYCNDQL